MSSAGAPDVKKSSSSVGTSRSSVARRRAAAEQGACSKCWNAWTKKYNHFANDTVFGRAFTNEYGALFNFIVSHIIFWSLGLPTVIDHGYDNDDKNGDGGIPSGSRGSGVFIVTVVLCVLATILYVFKMVRNVINIKKDDAAKAAAKAAADAEVAREKALHTHTRDGGAEENKASA